MKKKQNELAVRRFLIVQFRALMRPAVTGVRHVDLRQSPQYAWRMPIKLAEVSSVVRGWARRIKRDAITLWFASRNPATPWLPKALCVFVVAYALSPIDLIPDFIPVLGYLDDVLLLPGLIWLALRLLPPAVLAQGRVQAETWMAEQGQRPRSHVGAAVIVLVWLLLAALAGYWLWRQ